MNEALARLPHRQQVAALALLEGRTAVEAAAAAHVSPRTLTRWQARQDFRAALAAARGLQLRTVIDRLGAAAGEAVETLRAALADDNVFARVQAGSTLVGHAVRVLELSEIEARIAALEHAEADAERERGEPGRLRWPTRAVQ